MRHIRHLSCAENAIIADIEVAGDLKAPPDESKFQLAPSWEL